MATMRFCKDCNNMLYPRENRAQKKLEYFCKKEGCGFVLQNVKESCVFINALVKDSSTRLDAIQSDLKKDPTLQRMTDIDCVECGHHEAVFFQAEQSSKSKVLNLVLICCNCGHKWWLVNEEEVAQTSDAK